MVENDINANMFSRLDQIDCCNLQSDENTSFSIPDFQNLNFGVRNSKIFLLKQTEHGQGLQ